MANRFSPGCTCCGCNIFSNQLFPDFHHPENITCFKRYRENITVETLTTQLTQTWTSGVLSNNTVTLVDTTDTAIGVDVDTITEDNRAGKFEWVFPQVEVPFGAFVLESETGTPGVNGTRVYVPRTRVRTNRTVWEEYRLIAKYNVKDQFNFGRDDDAGDAIIKAATAQFTRTTYAIEDWVGATGQTLEITVKGLRPDAVEPVDSDEFDDLWAETGDNTTVAGGAATVSVLTWLPDTTTDFVYFLFFSDTAKRGLNLVSGALAIWDRAVTALPATPYNWKTHWIKEGYNTWKSVGPLPLDNYQISLANLLPSNFWNTKYRSLTVELFTVDTETGEETTVVEQIFEVIISDILAGTASSREWTISSDGHWGPIDHIIKTHSATDFPIPSFYQFSAFGPVFKIRGSVYELIGGRRVEGDLVSTYQWVPYWHEIRDEPLLPGVEPVLPSLYLRFKIGSDNPQQNKYDETGLQHLADNKNMLCPGNYTCSVTDDYAHPEWRVISHLLPGFNDTRLAVTASHIVCGVTLVSAPRTATLEVTYTSFGWVEVRSAEYRYHQPYVFTRGINCIYMDFTVTNDIGYWPGSDAGPSRFVGHSETFNNEITQGVFYIYSNVIVRDTVLPWTPESAYCSLGPGVTDLDVSYETEIHEHDLTGGGDGVSRKALYMAPIFVNTTVGGKFLELTSTPVEIDVSSSTWYSVHISHTVRGTLIYDLPSNLTSEDALVINAARGQEYYLAAGVGEGLVFKIVGLSSFVEGPLIGLGPDRSAGDATFYWEFVKQAHAPTLEEHHTSEEAAILDDIVGSVGYFYWIEDELFKLTTNVVTGPLEETDFTESTTVVISIDYRPKYHIGELQITGSTLDPVWYDDMTFDNVPIWIPADHVPGHVENKEIVQKLINVNTGPPTYVPGSGQVGFNYVYSTAPDIIRVGWYDNYDVTVVNHATPTDLNLGSISQSMYIEFSNPYIPIFGLYDTEYVTNYRKTYVISQIVTQTEKQLQYRKEVEAWKDRNLPTVNITGTDIVAPFNFSTGEFESTAFIKSDRIELTVDNSTKDGIAVVVNDEVEIDGVDLNLVIGPSTYVPPEPL